MLRYNAKEKGFEVIDVYKRQGFIFQNYNLVPILNVYENIVLPVELDGDTVDQKFLDEYITACKELLHEIRTQRMPWSVNQLAIEAGHYLLSS